MLPTTGAYPKEQVPLAFLRHATSKITQAEDLLQITSLGFRGEALSSISAVSQMEVITKAPEDFMGVRYVIEGGQEKVLEDVGAPNGTTMLVRNLFFNTPARKEIFKNSDDRSRVCEQLYGTACLISSQYFF